ncbi:hypothetical protein C0Q70_02789 [Pomacea canaliculata]|uniref:Uncharacterized protein n=1 Tax=Pomacea canaliculata TaxID=400727 RepID=A0A2T7PR05_POMCA|nr:hypothetical protein C0Q70_02789 [Pomacea canaliculata]
MVKRDKAVMQGVATLETYSSKWPYFDALDVFLGGVVQKRRYESLMSCGGRHDNMYIEDHHSDTDNDMSDLCRQRGDNSFVHASSGDSSKEGQEGPPLKRAKVEPWSDLDPSSCFAEVCDNNSISGGGVQQELRGAANTSPMSSTASHPSLPLGGSPSYLRLAPPGSEGPENSWPRSVPQSVPQRTRWLRYLPARMCAAASEQVVWWWW